MHTSQHSAKRNFFEAKCCGSWAAGRDFCGISAAVAAYFVRPTRRLSAQKDNSFRDQRQKLASFCRLAGHLLAHATLLVTRLDLEVRPEQLDNGQIAGGLAVGDRPALEDERARQPV